VGYRTLDKFGMAGVVQRSVSACSIFCATDGEETESREMGSQRDVFAAVSILLVALRRLVSTSQSVSTTKVGFLKCSSKKKIPNK